ncbi:hypothetical protein K503DRAFT_583274 [Rhizopogon vinicolor AM-OR11-026]|uniref:Uncharacterized protein n=1 Tax=Rhizopogon vinicolor AM-OR11-026 TaxID=1314800 RepID=A0A1B7N7C6_9AGAM|nr:hypothetical protein K503DRAFT_583274 [Rhizopogon vinicolor AM-OR11-026]
MKFIALTTMIAFVAVMAGANNTPIGHPCAQTNSFECGHLASYKNGIAFVFWCGSQNTVIDYTDCDCDTCCVDSGSVAYAYCTKKE